MPWVLGRLGPRPCCGVPSALISTRGRGFRPIVCQGDWTSGGQMIPLWGQQLLVLSGYHVRGWGCSAAHSVAGEGLAYGVSGAVCCGWGLGRSPWGPCLGHAINVVFGLFHTFHCSFRPERLCLTPAIAGHTPSATPGRGPSLHTLCIYLQLIYPQMYGYSPSFPCSQPMSLEV